MLKWILIIIAVLCVIELIMGYYFFDFAIVKDNGKFDSWGSDDTWGDYAEEHRQDMEYINALPCEEVWITSSDGLRLHARYFENPKAERTILCAHGYRGTSEGDFASSFRWLHEKSSLLLIDERCCGKSEGKYFTFGAMEKKDVLQWAEWLEKKTETSLPLYLYGLSLGSATVMMTSCMNLPSSVKGIIADCGYTSMYDIFSSLSWRWFHIPGWPLVSFVDFWCRVKGGFRMKDADASTALKHAKVPVLFIHGKKDDFVLPENTVRNHEVCAFEKDVLYVEGAGHVMSHHTASDLYERKTEEFMRACIR